MPSPTPLTDLLALQAMMKAQRAAVRMEQAAFYPSLQLMAQREWNDDALALENDNTTVAGVVQFNLFAGGTHKAKVDGARAELARLRHQLEGAQRAYRAEVARAWRGREEARSRAVAQKKAERQAAEALRIVELRYKAGLERTVDLLQAQARLQALFGGDSMNAKVWLFAGVLGVTVLAGCSGDEPAESVQPAGEVKARVITLEPEPVPVFYDASGSVVSEQRVTITSRLSGYIRDLEVNEGDRVKAGQVLFRVDPVDVRSQQEAARARLVQAEADLADAESDLRRFEALVEQGAASRRQLDKARLRVKVARSAVEQARAALRQARNQLTYAEVRAPGDGIVVRKLKAHRRGAAGGGSRRSGGTQLPGQDQSAEGGGYSGGGLCQGAFHRGQPRGADAAPEGGGQPCRSAGGLCGGRAGYRPLPPGASGAVVRRQGGGDGGAGRRCEGGARGRRRAA